MSDNCSETDRCGVMGTAVGATGIQNGSFEIGYFG
jgi:hypothetical protein